MQKTVLLCLILWLNAHALAGQSAEGLQWILPVQSDLVPIGKASAEFVALKGEKVVLMDRNHQMTSLPYDSITNDQHAFWLVWKDGLQGVYHETKGELLPPVFEKVKSALKTADNWTFHVWKYGMNAVVNDRNQLLLPYQKYSYGTFTFISDTILGYTTMGNSDASIDRLYYVSYQGREVKLPVAREFFPPDFQRVSANEYVLTQYRQGVPSTQTFPEAGKFVKDIAVVRKDSLWGYLDRKGQWLIPPRFQAATSFEKGRFAVVKANGKFGAINLKGEFVVSPQYDVLKVSIPGYFEFKHEGDIGLLDSVGQGVVQPGAYSKFVSAGTQCVAAKSGDSLLIFRNDGSLLTADRISNTKAFRSEVNFLCERVTGTKAKRDQKGLWGMMSPEGKWLIDPVVNGTIIEREHFILVEAKSDPCCQIGGLQYQQPRSNQYFIFDWNGTPYMTFPVVTSHTFEHTQFLIFDRANQFGIVTYLRQQIEPIYDEIQAVGNGWVKARQGTKWGLLKWQAI